MSPGVHRSVAAWKFWLAQSFSTILLRKLRGEVREKGGEFFRSDRGYASAALLLKLFKYCESLVAEAHAWEVTGPMLEEQCVFANQESLLIQRVIFT
jgi:hypothetical protein